MKRLFFIAITVMLSVGGFAQDLSAGLQAKNAGNDAYRAKNYVEAIKNWEVYFNSGEEGIATDENTKSFYTRSFKNAANDFVNSKDYASAYTYYQKYVEKAGADAASEKSLSYSIAFVANKIGKDDVALSYFQKSIEIGYKGDLSSLFMAIIYKKADDEAKMKEILTSALEKYPDSKYKSKMAEMLAIPVLREAAIPLGEANELAKAAQTGEANSYLSNMARAIVKFEEAIPLFEKVLKLDPTNDDAIKYMEICKANIRDFNKYKASLDK